MQIATLNSLVVPLAPSTSSASPSRCHAKTKTKTQEDTSPAPRAHAAAGNRRRGPPPSITKPQKVYSAKLSTKEKLAVRRRRLRLIRTKVHPQLPDSSQLLTHQQPQPLCRLQISSTIFEACNGQPGQGSIEIQRATRECPFQACTQRQAFPEELHMPLLFNDEPSYRFEEQRYPDPTPLRLPQQQRQSFSSDSGADRQLYGVFVNPLAFVRNQQQQLGRVQRSNSDQAAQSSQEFMLDGGPAERDLQLASTSSASPLLPLFESEISFMEDHSDSNLFRSV